MAKAGPPTSRLQGAAVLPWVHTTAVAPAASPVESGTRAGRAPLTLGPVNVMLHPKSSLPVKPLPPGPDTLATVTVKPVPGGGAATTKVEGGGKRKAERASIDKSC